MSNIPGNLKYAATHEWVLDNGDGTVTVGITDHAQDQLGDVVFVDLPENGRTLEAGEEFSVVESVKTASDLYAPVTGEIIAVNEDLEASPEIINEHPYEDGWIIKIRMSDASELNNLLDGEGYDQSVEAES